MYTSGWTVLALASLSFGVLLDPTETMTTIPTTHTAIATNTNNATIITTSSSTTSTSTSLPSGSTPTLPAVSGNPLRMLTLGDSITAGIGAYNGNGWRTLLEDPLKTSNNVTMIGGVQSGTSVTDPFCDCYTGQTIEQIQNDTQRQMAWLPNVVLLHAGTNNLIQNRSDAVTPLSLFVDNLFNQLPNTVILLAQIIPSPVLLSNSTSGQTIQDFNRGVASIVSSRAAQGRKILVVDMFDTAMLNNKSYFADDRHPNQNGYQIMANMWDAGLRQAQQKKWLTTAVPQTSLSLFPPNRRKICFYGGPIWQSQGTIFSGGNFGKSVVNGTTCVSNAQAATSCDCTYVNGAKATVPLTGTNCAAMSIDYFRTIQFADLDNDGRSDLIWSNPNGTIYFYRNLGTTFTSWTSTRIPATAGARRDQIQFADLTGDGRADMIWVRQNGSVQAWYNKPNGASISWTNAGVISNGFGLPGAGVKFWDINGDSQADYCYVDPGGKVTVARNMGNKVFGTPQLIISTAVGARDQVVMADFNGNGFAGYVRIDRTNGTAIVRASFPDDNGGAAYAWTDGSFNVPASSGIGVQFADLDGNGRADFINVDPSTSAVTAWLNGCPTRSYFGRRSIYGNLLEWVRPWPQL